MSRKRIKKKKVSKGKAMKELRREIRKSIDESDKTAKPIEGEEDTPQEQAEEEPTEVEDFQDVT